jgi:hypothetical protein
MALQIVLYPEYRSIYRDYMTENYGKMFLKDPGIFTLPSWLYSYDLHKAKIRFKGIQKISMNLSEFEEQILISPSRILGAILVYNCQFDFETAKRQFTPSPGPHSGRLAKYLTNKPTKDTSNEKGSCRN